MKKTISLLTVICLLILSVPFCTVTVNATEQDDYIAQQGYALKSEWTAIRTADELAAVASRMDGNYYLAADIFLSENLTKPLCNDGLETGKKFIGVLDGCGYSITFAEGNKNSGRAILFLEIGGTVKNLTIGSEAVPVVVEAGTTESNIGVVAGTASGETLLENIKVYATMSALKDGAVHVGGLIGKTSAKTTVKDCEVYGSADMGSVNNKRHFGGMVSNNAFADDGLTITGCVNYMNVVSACDTGYSACAGIVGAVSVAGAQTTVENCVNFGNMTVNTIAGGIIGNSQNGNNKIINCLNLGAMVSENPQKVGGLYGNDDLDTVTVKDSVSFGQPDMNMITGAAIRFNQPTGLRFRTVLGKNANLDLLKTMFGTENVKLGTLIAKTEDVTAAGAFTMEALDAYAQSQFITGKLYTEIEFDGTWFSNDGKTYSYTGAIENLASYDFATKYSGVGYVSVCIDCVWHTSYAACPDNSRSVIDVAKTACELRATEKGNGFEYLVEADNNYSMYTQEQLAALGFFKNFN